MMMTQETIAAGYAQNTAIRRCVERLEAGPDKVLQEALASASERLRSAIMAEPTNAVIRAAWQEYFREYEAAFASYDKAAQPLWDQCRAETLPPPGTIRRR